MAAVVYQIAAACVGLVLAYLVWKVVDWAYITPKRLEKLLRKQGLKGSSYRFIHGDLKEMAIANEEAKLKPINIDDDIRPRVVPFFFKTIQKYGKECFYWQGTKPTVMITDPEVIKEMTSKHTVFQKAKINSLVKLFVMGLFRSEKEKWAKLRKILNPAFHIDKLKPMMPDFRLSCDEVVKELEGIVSLEGGCCEVDVWPYLERLTSDAISRTAFGSSYIEGRKIFHLQREQAENVISATQYAVIPGWRFLPTKRMRRIKEVDREVRSTIRGLINRRMKEMEGGEGGRNQDLLNIMLESNLKEIEENGNNKSFGMSIDDIIEECKLFYFAGQETTSTVLVWTLVLLSRYPEWQNRARDEVLNVFGTGDPTFEGLSHLKIISMILYEVMRLYTPTTSLRRQVAEDTTLGGLTLPKGVGILVPSMMLHVDRGIWGDDAMEFKPERFSEGVSKAHKSGGIYFPFGWGPRICIGQNFALMEAKVALAMILRHFSFQLSASYTHAPTAVITTFPQHGVHLLLRTL